MKENIYRIPTPFKWICKQQFVYIKLAFIFLISLSLVLLLNQCEKVVKILKVETGTVSQTTSSTAKLAGNIIDMGEGTVEQHGHCWSTSPDPVITQNVKNLGEVTGTGNYISDITGLIAEQRYYYKAYAMSGGKVVYGEESQFTTGQAQAGNAPEAEFTASSTSIFVNGSVTFTDLSTHAPTSWSWDFGDDGSSSDQNPSHVYTTQGNYTVTLIATNQYGSDSEVKNAYISVSKEGEPPEAEFTASSTSITENSTVTFTDQSINYPTSWSWDFGDGGTSPDQNPSHVYTTAGTYTVSLTATNSYGSDTEEKNDYINVSVEGIAPVAEFTASSTSITENSSVSFTDLSINAPTSWSWNFGDGGTSPNQNPSHVYTTAGTYTVSLTATNSYGSDTEEKNAYITVSSATTGTVTDHEGNVYQTVKINDQWWMAENLRSTEYSDGSGIPIVTDNTAWGNLGDNDTDQGCCFYDNNSANGDPYGALYTWAAVMNGQASSTSNPSGVRGVCPSGWHVPSDAEWTELENYISNDGHNGAEGAALKTTYDWYNNGNGTDDYGFSALPAGYRHSIEGTFINMSEYVCWWSSTTYDSYSAYYRYLYYDHNLVISNDAHKSGGLSVRCVKD